MFFTSFECKEGVLIGFLIMSIFYLVMCSAIYGTMMRIRSDHLSSSLASHLQMLRRFCQITIILQTVLLCSVTVVMLFFRDWERLVICVVALLYTGCVISAILNIIVVHRFNTRDENGHAEKFMLRSVIHPGGGLISQGPDWILAMTVLFWVVYGIIMSLSACQYSPSD